MAIMDAQLDKFEAAEEILGVCISNTVSDNIAEAQETGQGRWTSGGGDG